MAHGESNGHVTDDVTWPERSNLWPPIRLESNISKTVGDAIITIDSLLWCSTVGYPSDSWLLVFIVRWTNLVGSIISCLNSELRSDVLADKLRHPSILKLPRVRIQHVLSHLLLTVCCYVWFHFSFMCLFLDSHWRWNERVNVYIVLCVIVCTLYFYLSMCFWNPAFGCNIFNKIDDLRWPWTATSSNFQRISRDFADLGGNNS